jgi:hypothetical protein
MLQSSELLLCCVTLSQTSLSSQESFDIGKQIDDIMGRMDFDSHLDYWGRTYVLEHLPTEHLLFSNWKSGLVCCWLYMA